LARRTFTPLDDHDLDLTWADDDPRVQAWLRATELRFRLGEAMVEYIIGGAWRPRSQRH